MTSEQYLKHYFYPDTPNVSGISVLELEKRLFDFSVSKYFKALQTIGAEQLSAMAGQKALKMFHRATVEVPAYRLFLKSQRIRPEKIRTLEDLQHVPPVTKSNYLSKYASEQLHWNGKSVNTTMISVSSGSTGKPYYWPRNAFLEYDTALTHEAFAESFFRLSTTPTLVIDAYSMGMYVAGTFTLNSFRKLAKKGYPVTVVSPGIDVHEVVQILKDIGDQYSQVVLAGYPPFVKDILDQGTKERIPLSKFNMKFVFGAENFTEEWRTNIMRLVGVRREQDIVLASMNTYGSADCAVLGHETPLSIALRRAINQQRLSRQVFGRDFPPTLVQYNPLQRFFQKADNHLVFTANGGVPLVRYDIKDEGELLTYDHLRGQVSKQSFNSDKFNPWKELPFLALAGRSGNTVTLYGLNIYPESIRMALDDPRIIKHLSGKFKLATKNDRQYNQYLEIMLELSDSMKPSLRLQETIQHVVVSKLRRLNFEYAKLYEKLGRRADPKIRYVSRGTFQQLTSKHRWTTR